MAKPISTETKPCKICGASMLRYKISARKWALKKYCSMDCLGKANGVRAIGENNPAWKGGNTKDFYRRVAFGKKRDKNGKTCEICGTHDSLHIHHKNVNIKDNRRENLMVVCETHHKMIHQYIREVKNAICELPRFRGLCA